MTLEAGTPEIGIMDRVTLPRSEADPWIERLQHEYRPSAEARGLTLAGVWRTRADESDAIEVVVLWTLPGPREFFGMRATSHTEAVAAWWRETDALALRRERRVMQRTDGP